MIDLLCPVLWLQVPVQDSSTAYTTEGKGSNKTPTSYEKIRVPNLQLSQ
jgi:hypothetical protein